MIRTVNYSALTDAVTRAEVASFRERMRGTPGYAGAPIVVQVIGATVVVVVIGSIATGLVSAIVRVLTSVSQQTDPLLAALFLLIPVLIVGILVFVLAVLFRTLFSGAFRWERLLRLQRFAEDNGLQFSPRDADPQYPGAIFANGRSRAAIDHLRSANGRFLDYGNYTYTTGSGRSSQTHQWGFLALALDRSLPHMVLDSRANNGLFGGSNLPAVFSKDQVLGLEGDFQSYFTLYCPREYERDALYVFTPDLMALLIDEAAPFDVEIIDRWMFVYSSRAFDMTKPAVHQRLLRIVDTVGAKTLTQTDRYVDERIGEFAVNTVAPEGKRLRRGISIGAVVFVAVFAVVWMWPVIRAVLP